MEGSRVKKAGKGAEAWPRRRLSAAEWMGAERALALVASAEAEADAVRRTACAVRAAAFEEGRAEGLSAGILQQQERLVELAGLRAGWLARAEVEALDLAVEMARRILGRELKLDPGAAAAGASAALRAAGRGRPLRVRLHPEGAALLRERTAGLSPMAGEGALELVDDPTLLPGDVVVESEAGQVDGRIDRRLEVFRAALTRGAA